MSACNGVEAFFLYIDSRGMVFSWLSFLYMVMHSYLVALLTKNRCCVILIFPFYDLFFVSYASLHLMILTLSEREMPQARVWRNSMVSTLYAGYTFLLLALLFDGLRKLS